ncbi:unnamed protein product [Macrosiphum euphorbiae]|uniref:Uncharacterized protein n=1 Tax=Macrosiphum euphorbiae TaxID=13131 RepID=A0AAV0X5Z9_9HEMI|nr:unnamed protein product [Macrosiphum euphorbiae]CAI6363146.1 unnamed protein product [Macrosiphum euphorbiae]
MGNRSKKRGATPPQIVSKKNRHQSPLPLLKPPLSTVKEDRNTTYSPPPVTTNNVTSAPVPFTTRQRDAPASSSVSGESL